MTRIFISYSHQDEDWKDLVVRQLGVLAGEGLETWDDRRIDAGDDWFPEIQQALGICDVALLLISEHFLTSKFILGQEVPPLLERRQEQGIRIFPVILSPCQWQRVSWLKSIQARPKDGRELSGMSDHDAQNAVSALVGEIAALAERLPTNRPIGAPVPPDKIDLTRLPEGAPHFLGREKELADLDAAWKESGRVAIVQIIAPAGVGKTALMKRWLDSLRGEGWLGARRVFGWSFYSQTTGENRQASEDHFLTQALDWFGIQVEASLDSWDKGRKLAEAVVASRTLLVLDGVEPLQYPPTRHTNAGELHAPGLRTLLAHLATAGQAGLCVISSRVRLTDLAEYERGEHRPEGGVLLLELVNLSDIDGARLLHALGVTRAGAATMGEDDDELKQASLEVHGHALTLALLGNYLRLAYGGDVRKRDQVDFQEADAEIQGGHAFRVLRAYEIWFEREGAARDLAALRLLGYFDRPADRASLDALRARPPIIGLTEPLQDLSPALWQATLQRLQDLGLIYPAQDQSQAVDAHPLIREYLARRLQDQNPEAWREGHRRVFEQLKASAPYRPEGLAALQPLYQAVTHGCRAGLYEETHTQIYLDRILRGTDLDGFYPQKLLGAFSQNLSALANFFERPWDRPVSALRPSSQTFILSEASMCLRALGRLEDSRVPMEASADQCAMHGTLRNAATGHSNLSELCLALGAIKNAENHALRAMEFADRGGEVEFQRVVSRATLANALYQHGDREKAASFFVEAETASSLVPPDYYPSLYSVWGFYYRELLLDNLERAAWLGQPDSELATQCQRIADRAREAQRVWSQVFDNPPSNLTVALDHLSLARCALYSAILHGLPHGSDILANAQKEADLAMASLRASNIHDELPRGLLTRAWLRQRLGDLHGARADLDEVERIAKRGNMLLHLADMYLTRGRLFRNRVDLVKARELIRQCEYFRRLPELEDAETALGIAG